MGITGREDVGMTGSEDVGIKGKESWRGEHMERGDGDMGKEEVGTWRQGVGNTEEKGREHKEKQMPTGTSCTMLGDTILMGD